MLKSFMSKYKYSEIFVRWEMEALALDPHWTSPLEDNWLSSERPLFELGEIKQKHELWLAH